MARYPFKMLSGAVPPLEASKDNAALVLLDPQRYNSRPEGGLAQEADKRGILPEFDEYYEQADAAIKNMRRLVAVCRERGVRIIYSVLVAEAIERGDLSRHVRAIGLPVPVGEPGGDIRDEVAPIAGDLVLSRGTYSLLRTTDLPSRLRDEGIDTLILAGLMADLTVEMAAREAADGDFRVIVIWDASASGTLSEHSRLKSSLAGGLIRIRSTQEVENMLRGSGA